MTRPSPRYLRALERLLSSPTLPKLGLSRMQALTFALGAPERAYRVVHIAGTKGKGSTAAMTASILRAAGLKVGLTTSPHLLSARERVVVDGRVVDEDVFADLEARVHAAALSLDASLDVPSFFERMVAMSFCAFADAAVDVAVVEVGLGGRLDATNVVAPQLAGGATAVTRLGLDHQEFLGDTLAQIAVEKAGIFKRGAPAYTVSQTGEAIEALQRCAAAAGVDLVVVDVDEALQPALFGAHQRENASLARALSRSVADVSDDVVARGLAGVVWPGRYERFDAFVGHPATRGAPPVVVLDGAHNHDSALALRRALDDDDALRGRPRHLVLGMSRGHDPRAFIDVVAPGVASVVVTRAAQPRALPAKELAPFAARHAVVDVVEGVAAAVDVAAARAATDGGVVVVTGSLFVVGEARAEFVDMPRDPARPAY